jgi:hypothetical protein
MTVPTRYVVNNVYTEDPNRFGDLFFNIRQHKIFWVGALIGLIINIPYVIAQIVPAIPLGSFIGGGYGNIPLSAVVPQLAGIVQSIFPNAQNILPSLSIVNGLIFMLVPYEIATSYLFWFFILYWIYPGVVTRAGILAPGTSVYWSWPIPLAFFNYTSSMFGLGLVVLFMMRGRIKKAFSSFKQDYEVNGMSVRMLLSLGIVGAILFLLIWIAAGLDPISSILLGLVFTILAFGSAYTYAQFIWMAACVGYNAWKWVWPISSGLGLLPTVAPSTSANAAAFGYYTTTMGTCVGAFDGNSMYSSSILVSTYAIGADTKTDLKRLLTYMLVTLVLLAPFAFVFDAWFNSHVGISNTSQSSMDMFWWNPTSAALGLGVQSFTWSTGSMPIWQQAVGQLVWSLLIFASYFITARFPMLGWIFNPMGFAFIGMENYWVGWFNALIFLIAKYILNRTVGPRRAMEVTIEFVAGLAAGFGFLYLILGGYVFFTISLPNLGLLWK